jgi:DnaJ-class molecular chaperone
MCVSVTLFAAKKYVCVECHGKKMIKYDSVFASNCKTCKGKGKVTKKQISRCKTVTIYVLKKVGEKSNYVKVKETNQPTSIIKYDPASKKLDIERIKNSNSVKDGFKKR